MRFANVNHCLLILPSFLVLSFCMLNPNAARFAPNLVLQGCEVKEGHETELQFQSKDGDGGGPSQETWIDTAPVGRCNCSA